MDAAAWALIVGSLMVLMALGGSALRHLPLSTAMLYLPVGIAIGPAWLALAAYDPIADAAVIEHLTEVVVVVSLFTVGLKLSVALDDRRWLLPIRLAVVSMLVTVGLIALVAMAIGLPVGAAVLLGAILAPTDPVLASDVQVSNPDDRDRLRIALTGEGGLNDGTAFPLVMLGLGLLGLHGIGEHGLRWFGIDVVWAVTAGLAVGALLGTLVGRLVLHLRRRHKTAVGYDDFLALGLIGLAYGTALAVHSYGFLAVFAAGVALRRVERQETLAGQPANGVASAAGAEAARLQRDPEADEERTAEARAGQPAARGEGGPAGNGEATGEPPTTPTVVGQALQVPQAPVAPENVATDPAFAPAFMAHAMLGSNEQIERIGEVASVVLLGSMLWTIDWARVPWWFVPVVFLLVRPVSVAIGLAGTGTPALQRRMTGWFGIRGIGSMYYLSYAITHGVEADLARTLAALTLVTVVASIVVHGVSVTPLMSRYERLRAAARARRG